MNPHRIVLVEDNEKQAEKLTKLLRTLGHQVVRISRFTEAEELFKKDKRLCLVLLDLAFPLDEADEDVGPEHGLPGFVLCLRIRDVHGLSEAKLPVVVTSAYPDGYLNVRKALVEYKANDFLGKPIDHELLNQTVSKWLERSCEKHYRTCPHTGKAGKRPRPAAKKPHHKTDHTVHLQGEGVGRLRYKVQLDGDDHPLTEPAIRILHTLAEADRGPGEGWLAGSFLGVERPSHEVSKLRKELAAPKVGITDLIQVDHGRYRLTCPPENVTTDDEVMADSFEWFRRKPKALPPAPAAPATPTPPPPPPGQKPARKSSR